MSFLNVKTIKTTLVSKIFKSKTFDLLKTVGGFLTILKNINKDHIMFFGFVRL